MITATYTNTQCSSILEILVILSFICVSKKVTRSWFHFGYYSIIDSSLYYLIYAKTQENNFKKFVLVLYSSLNIPVFLGVLLEVMLAYEHILF